MNPHAAMLAPTAALSRSLWSRFGDVRHWAVINRRESSWGEHDRLCWWLAQRADPRRQQLAAVAVAARLHGDAL